MSEPPPKKKEKRKRSSRIRTKGLEGGRGKGKKKASLSASFFSFLRDEMDVGAALNGRWSYQGKERKDGQEKK